MSLITFMRPVRFLDWLKQDDYLVTMMRLAAPIALQSFVISGLNLVSGLLVGQLGDASIAAVGLANQIFFLLQLLLFGFNSGAAMFTAQLWGSQNLPEIRRVLGLSLWLSLLSGLLFFAASFAAPDVVLGIYTRDPQVIRIGAQYLQVFSGSFIFTSITFSFAAVMRSIGDVRTPLFVSVAALGLSVGLTYGLIFGLWGLPEMGALGAAWSILISRIFETSVLLAIVYLRHTLLAASWRELTSLKPEFSGRVLRPILPIAINEVLWSFGITTFNVIYARIGTEAYAAVNMVATLDAMAFVFFIGLGNACAIMVGNQIGSGNEAAAVRTSNRSLVLAALGGLLVGSFLQLLARPVLNLYQVSPSVLQNAREVLAAVAVFIWLRASNMVLLIGAIRSGGDTKFGMIIESLTMWGVGVPLAYLAAFTLRVPLAWVYVFLMGDELVKWLISMRRYFSRRWIHDLTRMVSIPGSEIPSG